MDQGTEKWLLTFRWMLWLAPAGLRGCLKLEAYHQSRQPQSFFLCGPRCSGTSVRSTRGVAASFSYALLRQPYLRPRRCGDFGLVSRHKPAEHRFLMFPLFPTLRRRVSHAEERLRYQRFFTCRGAAAISTPLTRRGSGCEDQRLSDHQTSPACHGQTAGITFQLSP